VPITFIDSDSRKKTFLTDHDQRFQREVLTPLESMEKIRQARKLIVFTRRNKQAILDSLVSHMGKCFRNEDILTIDINP
jgi:hypothetical protein